MQDVDATVALNFNSSCDCMHVARIHRGLVCPGVNPGFLVWGDDEKLVHLGLGLFTLGAGLTKSRPHNPDYAVCGAVVRSEHTNRLSAHDSPLDVAQVKVVITTALC